MKPGEKESLKERRALIEKIAKKVEVDNINFGFDDQPFPIELSEIYTCSYNENSDYFKCFKEIQRSTKLDKETFYDIFPNLMVKRLSSDISVDHINCLKSILYFLNEDYSKCFTNAEIAKQEISKKYIPFIEIGFFELIVCMLTQTVELLPTVETVKSPYVKLYSSVSNLSCAIVLQFLFFVSSVYNVSDDSKGIVNDFIQNDERGKYLLDVVINLFILFAKHAIIPEVIPPTNPPKNLSKNLEEKGCLKSLPTKPLILPPKILAKLHFKKFVILLRVLIIKTLGTFSDAKCLRQTSRKLYGLPSRDYKGSFPLKDYIYENNKSYTLKIRRHELEFQLYTMFHQTCSIIPRCVSLDVKYECFTAARWKTFTDLKKHTYIPLVEAQCDRWADFINYPLTAKIPPLPPSAKITNFYSTILADTNFAKFLGCILQYIGLKEKLLKFLEVQEYVPDTPLPTSDNGFSKYKTTQTFIENSRYKEIIAKNVLQIIFHLIEHLKSNHAYQLLRFLRSLNVTQTDYDIAALLDSRKFVKLNKSTDLSHITLFGSLLVKYIPDPKDYIDGIPPYQPTSTRRVLSSIFLIRILTNIIKFDKEFVYIISIKVATIFYYRLISTKFSYIKRVVYKLLVELLRALPPKYNDKEWQLMVVNAVNYRLIPLNIQIPSHYPSEGHFTMLAADLNKYYISNEDIRCKIKKFNKAIINNEISYNPLSSVFWIHEAIKISQKENQKTSPEQSTFCENQNAQSTY